MAASAQEGGGRQSSPRDTEKDAMERRTQDEIDGGPCSRASSTEGSEGNRRSPVGGERPEPMGACVPSAGGTPPGESAVSQPPEEGIPMQEEEEDHSRDAATGVLQPKDSVDGRSGGPLRGAAVWWEWCPDLPKCPLGTLGVGAGAPWKRRRVLYLGILTAVVVGIILMALVIWGASRGRSDVTSVYLEAAERQGTPQEPEFTVTDAGEPDMDVSTGSIPDEREEKGAEQFRFTAQGSDHFRILLTDVQSDSIMVGARNVVYNLSLSNDRALQLNKKLEWTAEALNIKVCRSRRKSAEDCQNYIRVIVNQSSSTLLICGTNAFKPVCRTYRQVPGSYERMDEQMGTAICPHDPSQNSTFTYADGHLYTGTTADVNGLDSLIYRSPTRTVQHDSQMLNDPDFVSSFEHGDHVYFFLREFAVEYINCGKAIYSRVGRVCKQDQGGYRVLLNQWTSFFKARLNCSIPGDFPFYFDEIQSTSGLGQGYFRPISDMSNKTDMIYAVFNTPENSISGSAVCAFKMSDIVASFEGGFKEQKTVYSTWLPVNERETPKPHPTQCVNDSKAVPIQTQNFIKSHPLLDRAVGSFGGGPILVQTSLVSRMTQIAVDWQRQAVDGKYYDVLFIGRNDGYVMKVINRKEGSAMTPVVIEEIRVFPRGYPVTGLQVYRAEKPGQDIIERLLVISKEEIQSIPLHRCGQKLTCGECVGLRDPYCSWDASRCRANTLQGIQNVDNGTGCPEDHGSSQDRNDASSSPTSAHTSAPCVCPEQRLTVQSTVASRQAASTTIGDGNTIDEADNPTRDDKNTIPNINSLQRTDPGVGASTQARGDTVSASTLAISLVFAILISLIVGFCAGYRTSTYRNKSHPDDLFMRTVKADPHKNLNRFDDSNRYNTHDYLPQPRSEKQVNVVFNPLKPNPKLPNGSAQTEVQKQKAKKVYL